MEKEGISYENYLAQLDSQIEIENQKSRKNEDEERIYKLDKDKLRREGEKLKEEEKKAL